MRQRDYDVFQRYLKEIGEALEELWYDCEAKDETIENLENKIEDLESRVRGD